MLEKQLNEMLEGLTAEEKFSGVVLIKKGNDELYSKAVGLANRNWNVKNRVDTRFRIASISKMFTAVAILQLIERNMIDFETKVKDYLGLYDAKFSEDVTIYHLLTHTSGISDYYNEADGDEAWLAMWKDRPIYTVKSLEDYLSLFIHKPQVFDPGEKMNYNGAGFILLGLIVEKASSEQYFDYIKNNIFTPLGMIDSDFLSLNEANKRVATGYEPVKNEAGRIIKWETNIYTATPTAASDGGATSTAEDLVKFIQGLKSGKLLSERLTKEILTPKTLDKEANGARGYTWKSGYANIFILNEDGNVVRGGHTGEEFGVSCRLYYYPKYGIDVAIMSNQGWTAGSLGWKIHDLILEYI